MENIRSHLEIEFTRVEESIKKMGDGKLLEIRKSSKDDDEFLNTLVKEIDTSREIIDRVSFNVILPIESWEWYTGKLF